MGDAQDVSNQLESFLSEIRILVPGTQIFMSMLLTLPFTNRFDKLDAIQRWIYLATFFSLLLAFALFMVPAAYHRINRPIRDKRRFKVFANRFVVAGMAPFSISAALSAYLLTSAVHPPLALAAGIGTGAVILALWWVIPLLRPHDAARIEKGGLTAARGSVKPAGT